MNGDLSLTSAIFQIEKDNTRSQISPGVYELTGNIRVRGFQATAAGRILRKWQVFGGYTFLERRNRLVLRRSTAPGKGAGEHAAQQRLDVDHVQPHRRDGRSAPASPTCRTGSLRIPTQSRCRDYLRWDAMVAYQQPKYAIQLNVFNLTNRLNYDALIPSDKGRSVPGTDLQAMLTFTYKFF